MRFLASGYCSFRIPQIKNALLASLLVLFIGSSFCQEASTPSELSRTEWKAIYQALPYVRSILEQPYANPASELQIFMEAYAAFVDVLSGTLRREPKVWREANLRFINAIDYKRFFDHFSLERDKLALEKLRQFYDDRDPIRSCGKLFLFEMAEQYHNLYALSLWNLDYRMMWANSYLSIAAGAKNSELPGENLTQNSAEIYHNIGRFFLVTGARFIENKITRDADYLESEDFRKYKALLAKGNVFLNAPASDWDKTLGYLREGEVDYVLDRFFAAVQARYNNRNHKINQIAQTNFKLVSRLRWRSSNIQLYDIVAASSGVIGTCLMVRDLGLNNSIGYQAHESKGYKLKELGRETGLAHFGAVCTGSYSTETWRSIGFSAVRGVVANYYLDPRMDGLAFFTPAGQVQVVDMSKGITLDDGLHLDPNNRLVDLAALWDWVERKRLSCFQSHLLIYAGRPLIDPKNASTDLRERRLLIAFPDRRVAIVDFPGVGGKRDLVEATYIVLRLFQNDPYVGQMAAINLDVGRYDVYRVYDAAGKEIVKSRKNLDVATNLIYVGLKR